MGRFKWGSFLFVRLIFLVNLLWFTFSSQEVSAQEFPIQYFDVDEGLPTTRVDHLRVLESGKLFVGGRGIVSIYDGYQFKELNSDAVLWYWFSSADNNGTVWFADAMNGLTKIENGKLITHPGFENLKANYNKSLHTSLAFDKNNTAYIGSQKSWILLRADSSGNVDKIDLRDSFPPRCLYVDTRFTSSPIFGSTPTNKEVGNNRSIYVNGKLIYQSPGSAYKVKAIQFGEKLVVSADRTIFIIDDEKVDEWDWGGKVKEWEWENIVNTLFEDRDGRLWIGTKKGAYIISSENKSSHQVLHNRFVTSICQDNEGHIWIGTSSGLFKTRSLSIHNFYQVEGKKFSYESAPTVHANDSQIFFLGETGQYTFNGEEIAEAEGYENVSWKLQILLNNNAFWLRRTSGSLSRVQKGGEEVTYRRNGEVIKGIRDMWVGSDDHILIAKPPSILKVADDFKTDTVIADATSLLGSDKSVDLVGAHDGAIYLRQEGNLYKAINDTAYAMAPTRDGITLKQVSELAFRKGMTVIGTMWDGIWLIDRDTHLIKYQGLFKPRIVEAIEWENDSTFWVGGSTGLFRVRFRINENAQISTDIKSWGKAEGLPSSDISRLKMHKGKLWVGTRFGISYLNPRELDKKEKVISNASIKWVRLHDTVLFKPSIDAERNFGYRDNRLAFGHMALSFKVDKYYAYRLKGLNDKWTISKDTFVSYSFVPPGEYTYQVKSVDPRYGLESTVDEWSFTISKPFWRRGVFLIPVGIAIQLLVLFVILGVNRSKRRRSNLEKSKLQSEIKALRAQFNPHFVFNALGAIQETMMSGNRDEAVGNMSKLASLMRKMLEATRRKRSQLWEVEEILNLYLDLEIIRQPGKFSYKVTMDNECRETSDMINVPISLIQPFVENAAIHGAPSATGHGEILLHFSIRGDYLITEIKDNGRGMDTPSKASGHDNSESIGLSLVKEQVDLMNQELEQNISLEIESKQSSGTRVILRTPLNF